MSALIWRCSTSRSCHVDTAMHHFPYHLAVLSEYLLKDSLNKNPCLGCSTDNNLLQSRTVFLVHIAGATFNKQKLLDPFNLVHDLVGSAAHYEYHEEFIKRNKQHLCHAFNQRQESHSFCILLVFFQIYIDSLMSNIRIFEFDHRFIHCVIFV